MKYIIIHDDEQGSEFPVFCLAPVTHAEMAAAWRRSGEPLRVVSAGFVEFLPYGVRTFGRSTSLGCCSPRPGDARLIAAFYKATLSMGLAMEAAKAGAPSMVAEIPA